MIHGTRKSSLTWEIFTLAIVMPMHSTCILLIWGGGVGIYDISDRRDPKFITRFQTPNTFAHNVWTSPDGNILLPPMKYPEHIWLHTISSDLNNIRFFDKCRNEDTQIGKVIPHNTYARENYTITSWYTDGILIHDMTRPENIVKVSEYDTFWMMLRYRPVAVGFTVVGCICTFSIRHHHWQWYHHLDCGCWSQHLKEHAILKVKPLLKTRTECSLSHCGCYH